MPHMLWGIFQAFFFLLSATTSGMTIRLSISSAPLVPFQSTQEPEKGKTGNCQKHFRKMASCFVHVTSLFSVMASCLNACNPIKRGH